jgi:(2Fe-2S) ferredoxin
MAFGFLKKADPTERVQPTSALRVPTFCKESGESACITVCARSEGCTCGCEEVKQAIVNEIRSKGLVARVGRIKAGCNGECPFGPLVGFPGRGFYYHRLSPERARQVVSETLENGHILFDLLHVDPCHATSGRFIYDHPSGFIAAIDENSCMVQVARYFLEFEREVSCGKCVPCRAGSVRLREILDGIVAGKGRPEEMEEMTAICEAMRLAAYCNYGAFGSGPLAAILKHFRGEVEVHITEKVCPTGGCENLKRGEGA